MPKRGVVLECTLGYSAQRQVLIGFAPANLLYRLSFADVLDEDTGRGYQRRPNPQHSLDFRRYIQLSDSTTIPLTFNLRPEKGTDWKIRRVSDRRVQLTIADNGKRVFAQVDCQHRLGHLAEVSVELPFMSFVGLSPREEMEIFNVINSKARGLSSSLLDFHDAQLSLDLAGDRPELFIALFLRNDSRSPWYRQLDLGGTSTSGLARRASLRTIQKAIKRFLSKTKILNALTAEDAALVILDFWSALASILPNCWSNPRKNLITKGIGVYALMDIAGDLYLEAGSPSHCNRRYFASALSDFAVEFDWSTEGPLVGLGGEGGVKAAVALLRTARKRSRLRMIAHG